MFFSAPGKKDSIRYTSVQLAEAHSFSSIVKDCSIQLLHGLQSSWAALTLNIVCHASSSFQSCVWKMCIQWRERGLT